jgi:hypothetical protein
VPEYTRGVNIDKGKLIDTTRMINHIKVLTKGNPIRYYRDALRRSLIRLLVRSSKDRKWIFSLYKDVKAILQAEDYLALWAY